MNNGVDIVISLISKVLSSWVHLFLMFLLLSPDKDGVSLPVNQICKSNHRHTTSTFIN
jgi:hypothetical protein